MKRNASARNPSERRHTPLLPATRRREQTQTSRASGEGQTPPPQTPEQAEGRRKSCQPCPAEAGAESCHRLPSRTKSNPDPSPEGSESLLSLSTHRRRQAESGCLRGGIGRHTDLSQKPDSPQSRRLKITG